MTVTCKKLTEVAMPLEAFNAASAREKSSASPTPPCHKRGGRAA